MMTGIRIVEAVVQKPLQALVGLLLTAIIALSVFAIQADKVHAEIIKDQEVTDKYQTQQDEMYEMVIRIDENVKQLKD